MDMKQTAILIIDRENNAVSSKVPTKQHRVISVIEEADDGKDFKTVPEFNNDTYKEFFHN
ncbi:CLUMA_CG017912, isoform A [Clunio marinus]|uniref:CLUMA_CG017912, isoform A n=1 Tax=Clunio marinus TaxID=568069 RepID=A0A1J1IX54_9DIPT|nr:CLUMA_CG017912, isoform A [Clunio marinus]